MQKPRELFYLLVIIVFTVLIVIYLLNKFQDDNVTEDSPIGSHGQMHATGGNPGATLSFEPESQEFVVGDTFSVDIILDTAGNDVDGVDIYSLYYDPTLLEVVDNLPRQSGTQIKAGSLISQNGGSSGNSVNKTEGTILFSQPASGGQYFNGKGVLATIQFKALKPGDANLKFDFIPGSTVETNVVGHGIDLLSHVGEANFSIIADY